MIVSSLPMVKYGDSHYRNFEREKISAIKLNKESFDSNMTLSERAFSDLRWWCTNISNSYNEITKGTPCFIIKTDTCETGGSAVYTIRYENWWSI